MKSVYELKNQILKMEQQLEQFQEYKNQVRRRVLSALEGSLFFTIENVDEDGATYSIRHDGTDYYISFVAYLDRTCYVNVTLINDGEPLTVLESHYNEATIKYLYMEVVESIC